VDQETKNTETSSAPSADALLEDVYRLHKRNIVRMLTRHAGGYEAAESLFHEACRVTLERLMRSGISDASRLAGFIYGTARRMASADRRLFVNSRTDADEAALHSVPDQTRDLQSQKEADELAASVRKLLGKLTVERDRLLLIRLYLREEDKDEVCADLGLTSEQFSRALFRAKMRFRTILESHGVDLSVVLAFLLVACTATLLSR
jgi:RNA polymerase sigma-70 factor, ECF subfamily